MSKFFMLAGTVCCDDNLESIQQRLASVGLNTRIDDDELEIEGEATLYFRSGFEHEYILVGDSENQQVLISETRKLSQLLQGLSLQHGYEIYDRDNQMIDEFDYQP